MDGLEFVELIDHGLAVVHGDVSLLLKCFGIAEADGCRAVAGDQLFVSPSYSPAFARVAEHSDESEGEAVVDGTDVGLPCPLVEGRSPVDDDFSEGLGRRLTGRNGLPVSGWVVRRAEWP